MLHLDLWWEGENLACDPGTYSYNASKPWNNPFSGTIHHNTVSVDALDQMQQFDRFLWLPWLKSRLLCQAISKGGYLTYWEGEHFGYLRLTSPVRHRRAIVRLDSAAWLVLDSLSSTAPHEYRLHWLLSDLPHQWDSQSSHLSMQSRTGAFHVLVSGVPHPKNYSLVRGNGDSPRGWRSNYYYHLEPALSLASNVVAEKALLWTLFSSQAGQVVVTEDNIVVQTESLQAALALNEEIAEPMIHTISLHAPRTDNLNLGRNKSE
jgi:hypothetical protein